MAKPAHHHHVYVILLRATPQDKGQPHVYVGMTGLTPEQRFKNHMTGNRSANIVERRGLRLMPELYSHLPTMSYLDGAKAEVQTAADLKEAGYKVTMYPAILNPVLQEVRDKSGATSKELLDPK